MRRSRVTSGAPLATTLPRSTKVRLTCPLAFAATDDSALAFERTSQGNQPRHGFLSPPPRRQL